MKTYSVKPSDVNRKWYVLDASEAPLGQIASKAAGLLIGKGKPQFSHHIDCGDFVVVTNSDQLVVSGSKRQTKTYHRHSGYPGGLKTATLEEVIASDSTKAVRSAIRGMLPVNKLRDGRLKRLKIYTGLEHGHSAQKPEIVSLVKEGK